VEPLAELRQAGALDQDHVGRRAGGQPGGQLLVVLVAGLDILVRDGDGGVRGPVVVEQRVQAELAVRGDGELDGSGGGLARGDRARGARRGHGAGGRHPGECDRDQL
jgi:hypothetical protein